MKDIVKKNIIIIKYFVIAILFLGYSVAISSSVVPTIIFNKSNLSMYAFGDLFFTIFSKPTTITLPTLILFLFNYNECSNIKNTTDIRRILLKGIINIIVFIVVITSSVLLAYLMTRGANNINFGFTDRSALASLMPAYLAVLLSFLFLGSYLLTYMLIAVIIERITLKSWLAILLAIIISYIDTGIRIILNSTTVLGILPSDNVLVAYLGDLYYKISRPSYIYSILYWLILITCLCLGLFIFNKKKLKNKRG